MKKQILVRTVLAAALVGFAGGSVAADQHGKTMKTNNSAETQANAPASAVGKYVVNAEGERIGRVIGVLNNKLFVSTERNLGIGSQPVVVDWYVFEEIDHEGAPALRTSMKEAEWKSNPVYAIPEGESKMDSDRSVGTREPKAGSTRGFVPPPN